MRRISLILTGLIVISLLLGSAELLFIGGMESLENRLLDSFVRQSALKHAPDPDVVILDIDEASISGLADEIGNWPWPRSIYAELLKTLFALKPAAVVFDLLLSEPDLYRPDSDAWLNEVLDLSPEVYFPLLRLSNSDDAKGVPLAKFSTVLGISPGPRAIPDARAALLLPLAIEQRHWRLGAINYFEDSDGIGRSYPLYLDLYGWNLPSLPVRLAIDQGWQVPDREALRLSWRGDVLAYPRFSFLQLLTDFRAGEVQKWQQQFAGKIVVLGTTASGLNDIRHTPISGHHTGVEILATVIDNLKNLLQLQLCPRFWPWVLLVVMITTIGYAFLRKWHVLYIGLTLAVVSALLLTASRLAVEYSLLVPLLTPLLFAWAVFFAAALHAYFVQFQQRRQTVEMFSRFLDPTVVQDLIASGENRDSVSGKSCELTILFSDIRGFTTLSESREPAEIVELLNRYFAMQVETVFKHGGTLDKFIGDAIMAFWGAPRTDEKQASHAVAAALEMVDNLTRFRQECGLIAENFDIGIGIHHGPAVVGFLGCEKRSDYTAIGDSVNLASRIEGLTKNICRVLVSEAVRDRAVEDFSFQEKGRFTVKGRSADVMVYEPERK